MRPSLQDLRLKKWEHFTLTKWGRVAHRRVDGTQLTDCGELSVLDVDRKDILAGFFNLCNGCFR